jgi:protein required for attachment to host cells
VLVANASQADIYSREKTHSPLELLRSINQPEARAKEQDLVSDAPGRAFDSAGQGRHALESVQTEKNHRRAAFARQIAALLDEGRQSNNYQQLIIIAAPALLGELRAQLNPATRKLVTTELDKDIVGQGPVVVADLIDAQF